MSERVAAAVPDDVGVGFRAEHGRDVIDGRPPMGWFEVHPENYMVAGGPRHRLLEAVRAHYPLSLHGVALSLGGSARPDTAHLAALKALIDRYEPGLVSEHLAWAEHDGLYFGDLLPVPLTEEALDTVCRNIEITQEALKRPILVENPTSYLAPFASAMPEVEFLGAMHRRTGCGLLVDVNNIFISATNTGFRAEDYVDALPAEAIGEIHLGGHVEDAGSGVDTPPLLIDSHSRPVVDPVWALYARLLARTGRLPTLVEWDNDVPAFAVLEAEAAKARMLLNGTASRAGERSGKQEAA